MTKPEIEIYTDGACSPNPGVGGWAAILISSDHDDHERELTGAESETTNNRMEMTAAIQALNALNKPCRVRLHTDSAYLRNAFTQRWLDKWQRNNWRTASKKPVANEDLWRALLEAEAPHKVEWLWVKGHAEDPMNERADELAVEARLELARKMGAA